MYKMNANVPALLEHCCTVYNALYEQAAIEGETVEDHPVWEGFTTKLFKELRLSVPYYTTVMNALKRMDCVRQLKRGGGGAPSKWILLQEPTRELFDAFVPVKSLAPGQGTGKKDILQQQVKDLAERVSRLEATAGPDGSTARSA